MRAQAALEFMIFFGFFAVVFLLVSSTLLQRQMGLVEKGKGELVKEVCLGLGDEMNTAFAMGDGYWKKVELKKELDYNVRIRNGSLSVGLGERDSGIYYVAVLADDRIEGLQSDSEGMIVDMSKGLMIRNRGGVVVLEQ